MASESLRAALNHVAAALDSLGYPHALMGGVALAVWNHPRATRDIDVLIGVDAASFEPVVDRLQCAGCRPKRLPPLTTLGTHQIAQFLYTPPGEFYDVQIDLFLAESDLQKSAIARRASHELPGSDRPLDVVQCDDLILLKLVAGRIIDRADAATLLRENRDAIDNAYLISWVKRLGLDSEFMEVWREAFPGEPPPSSSTDFSP